MPNNYINKIGIRNGTDSTVDYRYIGIDSDHVEVKEENGTSVTLTNKLQNLDIKIATENTPGIVQPGEGILIDENGVISAEVRNNERFVTQEEYNELEGTDSDEYIYYIKDADLEPIRANNILYSVDENTDSSVQQVIEDINDNIETINNKIYNELPEEISRGENLVMNSWFTINQLGNTTYNSTSSGYTTVDRWKAAVSDSGNNSIVVKYDGADSGITLGRTSTENSYFSQDLEPRYTNHLLGKNLTFSVKYKNGTIVSKTVKVPDTSSEWGEIGEPLLLVNNWQVSLTFNNTGNIRIWFKPTDLTKPCTNTGLRAVKVEIGKVSTLQYDVEPNYIKELKECQRYLFHINPKGGITGRISGGYFYFDYITPARLAVSNPGYSANISSAYIWNNGATSNPVSGISFYAYDAKTQVLTSRATIKSGTLSPGHIGIIYDFTLKVSCE